MTAPSFVIVGAGALGSILGAHLVAAGHPVRLLARGQRLARIQRDGLRIRGLVELDVAVEATDDPAGLGAADVVVLAVKTYQMTAALEGLAAIRPRSAFSVANGVLKNDQLAAAFGADSVVGCIANTSGELGPDGTVEFTRNVCLHLGATRAYGGSPVAPIADAIDAAGIVCRDVPAIESVEWSKFVGWVALMALAVIARAETGSYLSEPRLAAVAARLVRETAALAAHRGIALFDQSPLSVATIAAAESEAAAVESIMATGHTFATGSPGHRMSTLQDLERGNRLEVEETLGYAVTECRRAGLEAPTLETCYALVAGVDALNAGDRV